MKESSTTRFITLQELCDLLGLSKSRFYALQKSGIFPEAMRNPSNNRPVFDQELVRQCLGIVKTRVGANGQPATFNRKTKRTQARRQIASPSTPQHSELIESLASLGMSTTPAKVDEALKSLPDKGCGLDHPELVRQLFLQLRKTN